MKPLTEPQEIERKTMLELRRELGLNGEEFAAALCVPHGTLHNYETGRTPWPAIYKRVGMRLLMRGLEQRHRTGVSAIMGAAQKLRGLGWWKCDE